MEACGKGPRHASARSCAGSGVIEPASLAANGRGMRRPVVSFPAPGGKDRQPLRRKEDHPSKLLRKLPRQLSQRQVSLPASLPLS